MVFAAGLSAALGLMLASMTALPFPLSTPRSTLNANGLVIAQSSFDDMVAAFHNVTPQDEPMLQFSARQSTQSTHPSVLEQLQGWSLATLQRFSEPVRTVRKGVTQQPATIWHQFIPAITTTPFTNYELPAIEFKNLFRRFSSSSIKTTKPKTSRFFNDNAYHHVSSWMPLRFREAPKPPPTLLQTITEQCQLFFSTATAKLDHALSYFSSTKTKPPSRFAYYDITGRLTRWMPLRFRNEPIKPPPTRLETFIAHCRNFWSTIAQKVEMLRFLAALLGTTLVMAFKRPFFYAGRANHTSSTDASDESSIIDDELAVDDHSIDTPSLLEEDSVKDESSDTTSIDPANDCEVSSSPQYPPGFVVNDSGDMMSYAPKHGGGSFTTIIEKKLSLSDLLNRTTDDEYISQTSDDEYISQTSDTALSLPSGLANDMPSYGSEQNGGSLVEHSSCLADSAVAQDIMAGTFGDHYEIQKLLGKGSYGNVSRVRCLRTNNSYAVKVIETGHFNDDEKGKLIQEIDTMKFLGACPFFVRMIEAFTFPEHTYMVMEECKGGDLRKRLCAKGHFDEPTVRKICNIMFRAVGYMHNRGMVHRDLKPENVLLLNPADDTAVKLADFGLTAMVSSPNSLRTIIGTPEYMAPEIWLRRGYDQAADMWALGVMAYEMLCGDRPFRLPDDGHAHSQQWVLEQIRNAICFGSCDFEDQKWDRISDEALSMVLHVMHYNPAVRYSACDALKCAFMTETRILPH